MHPPRAWLRHIGQEQMKEKERAHEWLACSPLELSVPSIFHLRRKPNARNGLIPLIIDYLSTHTAETAKLSAALRVLTARCSSIRETAAPMTHARIGRLVRRLARAFGPADGRTSSRIGDENWTKDSEEARCTATVKSHQEVGGRKSRDMMWTLILPLARERQMFYWPRLHPAYSTSVHSTRPSRNRTSPAIELTPSVRGRIV
ncbi:hypothetical protein B0H13DRAFT_2289981 [Mycena leptocephala]|nr:hypothetical protein B0H13DRAFT_2289981 [Mycena leptocephala]